MSFKAYTFNVQHGEGTDGVTNYQRQIDAMVGDLFAIQERSHPDTGWDTPMSNAGNLLGLDIALAADFNYTPGMLLHAGGFQMDLFLRAGFVDCWRLGMANGTATAPWADLDNTGGPDQVVSDDIITHDTRPRIDGIYLKTVNRALTMTAVSVPDMRVTCSVPLEGSPLYCPDVAEAQRTGTVLDYGKRPTDHNPVWAEFSVNQTAASPVRRSNFSWFPNVRL